MHQMSFVLCLMVILYSCAYIFITYSSITVKRMAMTMFDIHIDFKTTHDWLSLVQFVEGF